MVAVKSLAIETQFVAEVEFGMPSKKCNNFGICRITPIGQAKKVCTSCSKTNKYVVVTVYNKDHIEMDFLRHSIDPDVYKRHFSTGKFLVEEDFMYDFVENKNHHFKVKKGSYYVIENSSMFKIVFR